MGCYVNPPNQTKEAWLRENALAVSKPGEITETHLPVCLVDNGAFTAAGVAFDEAELRAFTLPSDHRPKWWFMASREALRKVSPLAKFEEKKA